MRQRVKIKLRDRDLDLDLFEYGEIYEPLYLYRKSRYINEEFPNYAVQLVFEETLESLNLFDLSAYGPKPDEFDTRLAEARRAIDEFRLGRSQTIPDVDPPGALRLSWQRRPSRPIASCRAGKWQRFTKG